MSEINCNNCAICDFKESLCHWCDEMKRLGSAEDIEKVLIGAFSETKSDCISRQEVIDALCDNCDHVEAVCPHFPCKQYIAIRNLPLIQPEIIRCKDCEHWDTTWQTRFGPDYHYCPMTDGIRKDDFYCADAVPYKGEDK